MSSTNAAIAASLPVDSERRARLFVDVVVIRSLAGVDLEESIRCRKMPTSSVNDCGKPDIVPITIAVKNFKAAGRLGNCLQNATNNPSAASNRIKHSSRGF